ncbi:MAG: hypothetical protein ABSC64_22545 [Candidatus Korobacteraceae bacterium]|jgi:hypothetical protein
MSKKSRKQTVQARRADLLAQNLINYTNPYHPEYDPKFTQEIRSLRPDWFAQEDAAKAAWFAYTSTHTLPDRVPANPEQVYATTGWSGWVDWMKGEEIRVKCQKTTEQYRANCQRELDKLGKKLQELQ